MSSIRDAITSILSRPSEYLKSDEFDQNYDTELAFALTGLARSDLFSPFFPLHRLIASKLISYFMSIKNLNDFEKMAEKKSIQIYAFCVAVLNRSDTKNALLLSPAEMFPDNFFPSPTILSAIIELNTIPEGARVRIYR